jgi:hypothetical protein
MILLRLTWIISNGRPPRNDGGLLPDFELTWLSTMGVV